MIKLIKWLKSEGIYVYFLDMDKMGMCIIARNTIIVSSKISENEQIKVVYHELKHFEHKDYVALYKQFIFYSKMENEAEQNVIKESLKDYISYFDGDIEKINYINFLEVYELDTNYASYVIELLNDMKKPNSEKNKEELGTIITINGYVH